MNKRKRNVLLAAQQLFIEKGFLNTSIQEILDKAKISKGTFYNYFTSKNDCLVSILEIGREDAEIIRQEILIGKEPSDKQVFAEQITILMQIHKERNLIPIFQEIYSSGDPELRKSILKYNIQELNWLSSRLVDVYGQELEPYRYDCAIILYGMLQQFLNICRVSNQQPFNEEYVIEYVLDRMDDIIPPIIEKQSKLLTKTNIAYLRENKRMKKITQQDIQKEVSEFIEQSNEVENKKGRELSQYILKEFHSDLPNLFVIESILLSLRQTYKGTYHEERIGEITNLIWRYIKESSRK